MPVSLVIVLETVRSASWCAQAGHCVPAGQGLMNLFPGGRGSGDDEFFRDQLGTCIGNDVLLLGGKIARAAASAQASSGFAK